MFSYHCSGFFKRLLHRNLHHMRITNGLGRSAVSLGAPFSQQRGGQSGQHVDKTTRHRRGHALRPRFAVDSSHLAPNVTEGLEADVEQVWLRCLNKRGALVRHGLTLASIGEAPMPGFVSMSDVSASAETFSDLPLWRPAIVASLYSQSLKLMTELTGRQATPERPLEFQRLWACQRKMVKYGPPDTP